MRKICHLTSAHNRYDVRILKKECISLASQGFKVFLVVNDANSDETIDGVSIVSTGYVPKNRRERIFLSVKQVLKVALEIDAEIYHLHDPELLQIVKPLTQKGKKVIFDAHEDTCEQIMDKEWIPRPLRKTISWMFRKYQKGIISNCIGVITVTPDIEKNLKVMNRNTVIVTNYPILNNTDETINRNENNYIFFAGGISEQWCHDIIVKAVSELDDIVYKIAGPIEDGYLERLKSLPGWNKVVYLGRIPHEKVEMEYQSSIAGMAVNHCSQLKQEGTLGNTKLFEIMAASKPVICTNYRLWKEIIDKYHCGICVEWNNTTQIAEAIMYLVDNAEEARIMGNNGRKAVEEVFNWKTQEKILVDFYNRI